MKLTEAIQFREPLFESFGDLKGIIERDIKNGLDSTTLEGFENAYLDMQEAAGEYAQSIDFQNAKEIVKALRNVLQHPLSRIDLTEVLRNTKNSDDLRTNKILAIVTSEALNIMSELYNPAREEPDSDVVKSNPDYTIIQLNNYSAARKLCNDYNTNFCIGSSDTEAFDEYGQSDGKDTFAIITANKRVVIVHSGDNGYRITGHDNEDEVTDTSRFDTQEMEAIVADLSPPIPMDEVHDVLNEIIDAQYHGDVKEKVYQFTRAYMRPDDLDPSPIIEDYGIFGDFDTEVSLRRSRVKTYLHCFMVVENFDGTFSQDTTDFVIRDGSIGIMGGFGTTSVGEDPTAILSEDFYMNIFDIGSLIDMMKDSSNPEANEMGRLFEGEM